MTPETARADSPSGYTIDLTIPQNDDPDGLATPTVRRVDVTLPEGTSLNPGAVDGLRMCTDAQLGVGTLDAAACPDASKVGTVTFESPIAPEPMQGAVYLLAPAPGAPFRIGFDAAGRGVRIKTAGMVQVDPETGRLTTTFDDQPQLPFSKLSMTFKGGPRALLANPATCGPHESRVTVTPHGGEAATAVSSFVTQGADCALAAFAPAFSAGGTSTVAGGDTSFTMTLARADGQATLSGLRMSLPPGLAGRLDSVPACPVAAAAAGTCSEASRIGSVVVAAGAGSQPLQLPGRVYLTEGDANSIAGLSLVVPVQAGPLNLGTTVVRARIALRPSDFGLDIVSDPLPKMHVGIPLRIRSIGVDLDRPGFMINPSSCAPLPVTATVTGAGGATATLRDRFQVGGCDKLAFAPALSIKAGAKGRTAKGKATPLTVTLTQKPGQARMRMTSLRLPAAYTASPSALRRLCAPAALAAGRCEKEIRRRPGDGDHAAAGQGRSPARCTWSPRPRACPRWRCG